MNKSPTPPRDHICTNLDSAKTQDYYALNFILYSDFQDSQDRYENVINNKSKKSVEMSWTNKQCSVWKELIIVTLVWLHVELSHTQAQDNALW